VLDARNPGSPSRSRSLDELARLYWRPIYGHVRRRWGKSVEESKDLTQEFFIELTRKEFLDHLDPRVGRFRAYVRTALDNFARKKHRDAARDPGRRPRQIEGEAAPEAAPDQLFLRDWARNVLAVALEDLERECVLSGREIDYRLLVLHDVQRRRTDRAATSAPRSASGSRSRTWNNRLYRARRRYRELLMERIRETTSSEEEAEREFLELFQDDAA
jgi:DNA-directed RNA polymerase specialized sigma24 family protein